MGNTVTNTRKNIGLKKVIQYLTIASDGTEETATVIYDSSAVATANGKADPLTCSIRRVRWMTNSSSCIAHLLWDATTDVIAMSMPYAGGGYMDIDLASIGGIKNTAGTGITGDILLTTTGLNAGDSITLILEVDPEYP